MICPLCNREASKQKMSDHHLIPKCRGKNDGETVSICLDCHNAIHSFFSNKELEKEYSSVESLLSNERFAKHAKWLSKQDINKSFITSVTNNQRRRGRNG